MAGNETGLSPLVKRRGFKSSSRGEARRGSVTFSRRKKTKRSKTAKQRYREMYRRNVSVFFLPPFFIRLASPCCPFPRRRTLFPASAPFFSSSASCANESQTVRFGEQTGTRDETKLRERTRLLTDRQGGNPYTFDVDQFFAFFLAD